VVVSLVDARGKLRWDKLLEMKLDGVRFEHRVGLRGVSPGNRRGNPASELADLLRRLQGNAAVLAVKRACRVFWRGLGLLLTAPIRRGDGGWP